MDGPDRVLVVDDDPDVVESLCVTLGRRGYEVEGAGGPEEALQLARAWRPDVIVLHVMMPEGTDGFHFVWQLRNQCSPPLSQTPIIILSCIHQTTEFRFYPDRWCADYAPGEFLPVQGYLDKPASPDDLLAAIKQALRKKHRALAMRI